MAVSTMHVVTARLLQKPDLDPERSDSGEEKKSPGRLYPDDPVKAQWSPRTIFSPALMSRLGSATGTQRRTEFMVKKGDKFSMGTEARLA